jgi:hypothetical protein
MNWSLRYSSESIPQEWVEHFEKCKKFSNEYSDYMKKTDGNGQGVPGRPSTWPAEPCPDSSRGWACEFHSNPDYAEWEHKKIENMRPEPSEEINSLVNKLYKHDMLKGMHRASGWLNTPKAIEIQNGDPSNINYSYGFEAFPQKSLLEQGVTARPPMSTCMHCTNGEAW